MCILRAPQASRYYTPDPSRACVFVLAVDTLDRDRLSADYVPDAGRRIRALRWWRNGLNHLVFNLYSGTWPDYNGNSLGFDLGMAMLAKASLSVADHRVGFDVSLPLFNREHAFRGGEPGALAANTVPPTRKYALTFKVRSL